MLETLQSFLKFSTVLDWAVMFGTGFLILLALLLLIFVRRSKPFYFVIALAAIPLFGGLLSTFLKYQYIERALEDLGMAAAEAASNARAEAWMITYVAGMGSIVIALIGLLGVMLKRRAVV